MLAVVEVVYIHRGDLQVELTEPGVPGEVVMEVLLQVLLEPQ